MPTQLTRRVRLARKLSRPAGATAVGLDAEDSRPHHRPGGRRQRPPRPTRGPHGEVAWWQRPAPGGHEDLWAAVRHLQARRLQLGVSVADLARRATDRGHPLTRETLSRVLNGKQPTSWPTVEVLADLLGTDLPVSE